MKQFWIISVNMGYGHQRTAYPLKHLALDGKIINANNYRGIPEKDQAIWEKARKSYEFISTFRRIPLIGKIVFLIFDQFQKIFSFYPKRDLSKPNIQLKQIFFLIKKGWGRHLIEELRIKNKELRMNLPVVSTFFTPSFMAEFNDYPGEIFCVVCDADISRTWVPLNPLSSKIKYLAPTTRVVERLKLYGVKAENIFLTGYPLPLENLGTEKLEIVKDDLSRRLLNLDSKKRYFHYYQPLIENYLGKLPKESNHPLTIMFSVGGAGAQKEIGIRILESLSEKIKKRQIKIILSAGIKEKINQYFLKKIKNLGLEGELNKSIEILYEREVESYFQKFNLALRTTDILWTKPSELSFYAALGLPIIIAPPIGFQEEFNKRWLLKSGFGNLQEDPSHTHQWLFEWLDRGYLAECAMQGFIEGEKLGTFNIKKICSG